MKISSSSNILALASLASGASANNLRGGSSSTLAETKHQRALDGTSYYDNIQFCAQTSEKVDSDKYFWLTLTGDSADVKGNCLLTVPGGTDKDTEWCCTVDGTTQYNTDYDLAISDPVTIMDRSSDLYNDCGNNGGEKCPNYAWNDNEQGFAYFRIYDEDGNSLRTMSKYVCDTDCDGLTSKAGTCGSGGEDVYEHVHVGQGYCKSSIVTLSKACDDHHGYSCQNDHSYYTNMQVCAKTHDKAYSGKYFWAFFTESNEDGFDDSLGECLLRVPSGTSDSSEVCCTVETGSMTDRNDYFLQLIDPYAVTNGTYVSSDYDYCGPDGGYGCPYYNFVSNAQGFKYFHLKKENGDGIKKMDGFQHIESSCGLDDHDGSCNGYKKYEHIFVGAGFCLESAIEMEDGCSGYYCLDENCA